ncbi:Protein YIPF5 [Toxocara canis]|uniref:Protein YIPF5 n=1 Tax=Toxocara canis TaxID=6265 RepID=A0A0B2VHE7_TOXCA|nr:Protein YIPF5 [Toxocara canis]
MEICLSTTIVATRNPIGVDKRFRRKMSGYWMDDGTNSANSWYGQQGASQQQSWAQFDYSQPQPSYYSQHAMPQASNYYNGNMFIPSQNNAPVAGDDFENEPPLLEELGIDFSHIKEKTVAVLNPFGSVAADVIADQDLAGPLVFCLLFGGALLLHGKVKGMVIEWQPKQSILLQTHDPAKTIVP